MAIFQSFGRETPYSPVHPKRIMRREQIVGEGTGNFLRYQPLKSAFNGCAAPKDLVGHNENHPRTPRYRIADGNGSRIQARPARPCGATSRGARQAPKPSSVSLRAKSKYHNIVVTGTQWFDNKAGIGGGGAIDLVMHIGGVDFLAACRSLVDQISTACGRSVRSIIS